MAIGSAIGSGTEGRALREPLFESHESVCDAYVEYTRLLELHSCYKNRRLVPSRRGRRSLPTRTFLLTRPITNQFARKWLAGSCIITQLQHRHHCLRATPRWPWSATRTTTRSPFLRTLFILARCRPHTSGQFPLLRSPRCAQFRGASPRCSDPAGITVGRGTQPPGEVAGPTAVTAGASSDFSLAYLTAMVMSSDSSPFSGSCGTCSSGCGGGGGCGGGWGGGD